MTKIPDIIVRSFANEKLFVIPPSLRNKLAKLPIVSPMYITDKGYYPEAFGHYSNRPCGCDEYIINICVSGKGWFELGNNETQVREGQFFILPANRPHRYASDTESPWTLYWTHFKGVNAQHYFQQLPDRNPLANIDGQTMETVTQLYEHCFGCLETGFSIRNLIHASTTFNQILSYLFFHNPSYVQGISIPQFRVIEGSINYMRLNIVQQFELHQFADQANMSIAHYSRVFKAQTGSSPINYFIKLKIQIACRLLTTTDKSIRQVALALGYEDQFYFSRIFRKVMSVSPSQYQQKNQYAEQ
ncbi:MAG: AraC family transcriptional regulator [Anaerohalosphaera sp.]|nr:AraC family transcriptional regulator [Anaerohalosphaera sp.]